MPELPPGFENARPLYADELGTTYVAYHTERGEDVAVRLLNLAVPSRPARRQFRASCLAITSLADQRGVLTLHDAGFTAEHHPYLVTDTPAGTLAARLADGPLTVQAAAALGVGLATTLAAAHAAGVLHLDVRPANVTRTARDSAPLLAHFGVTRAVSAAGHGELPVECLLHCGREMFGWDTPGPAADVHGLGSTLYTILAGQAPYAAQARLGRVALYQRVLRGGPPPISRPSIPPQVIDLIAAMMDPNPAGRPDLGKVATVLADLASGDSRLTADWTMPPTVTPAQAPPVPIAAVAATPDLAQVERLADPPAESAASVPLSPSVPLNPSVPPQSLAQAPPTPSNSRRSRHTGLLLLVAAGLLALLAGFVWGIVTGSHPRPQPGPTVRATASATPISPAQLALYRAMNVKVSIRPAGILVTWSAPANTRGVNAFLVIPKVPGQPRTQSVGRAGRSVIISGLPKERRYCFVVVTLIESAAGQASTAATSPVCTSARPAHKRPRRTHRHRRPKV